MNRPTPQKVYIAEHPEIEKWFDHLEDCVIDPGTESFVDSIRDFANDNKFITPKQYNALQAVYDRT